MTTAWRPRSVVGHPTHAPSPLRHASTASSNSSTSGPPSRSSTISSHASSTNYSLVDRSRTSADTIHSKITELEEPRTPSPGDSYQSMRNALRPTVQHASTTSSLDNARPRALHSRSQSVETSTMNTSYHRSDDTTSPPNKGRPMSMALGRSDSVRHGSDASSRGQVHFAPQLESPELKQFQRSSTSHLRALSKFAEDNDGDDFTIKSKEQEVVGLHGRRRLQRTDSNRAKKTQIWGQNMWMDQQRQYLAAYEYLCHIGEAKEWIEDVMQKPIPPIVQLEEALRNGIILAEVVQALFPERKFRIYQGPKLTFRHSDNIAIFFRLLEEVELPDLFWFELVDLYEKKNIPKVIYCIHALSWLLWRKGMTDFRIGNLVGQLQFEDHELEATQKGLDKVGAMPNFSGMGANFGAEPEPEPEPIESEDERVDRELAEVEPSITDLQAQMRGALLRMQLGTVMQDLWESEAWIVDLQSKIRGDFAREISNYRLDMKRFAINLQAAARGYLARTKAGDQQWFLENQAHEVVALQSLIRGYKSRAKTQHIQHQARKHENGVRELQAAIRGAIVRQQVAEELHATHEAEAGVSEFQAAIRGALMRKKVADQLDEVYQEEHQVQKLQSLVRGMLQRKAQQADRTHLRKHESFITMLQAAARASATRKVQVVVQEELHAEETKWEGLQTHSRGYLLRQRLQQIRDDLRNQSNSILLAQSSIRGYLARHRAEESRKSLRQAGPSITSIQSASRGFLLRQKTFDILCELNEHEEGIVALQAHARALLCRSGIGKLFTELEDVEDSIIAAQTMIRGYLVRIRFAEKMRHYKENMEKVIKVQSFIRGKQQGEAYKVLTTGKNPPVGTVKNFVHLLNDSDFDFDEEIEFERLRKTIVQRVRENEHAEEYIGQLDIKIALLVKNKITLDDVVRHQKHFGGHVGSILGNNDMQSKDPFDLKALNKTSRKKLENYQELFFALQTQPQYLARLSKTMREQALPEPELKRVELLIMGVFGFAQKRREEYHLLKFISRAIKEEIDSCDHLEDYLRGQKTFFWSRILGSYVRSPRDRKYLRDLLSPLVKEDIMDNDDLDLESDPMQIYRSAINNEELRTGQRSRRPADIQREEAIRDPETRGTFIRHLQDLRDIADHFFVSLEDTLIKMPYGIRFVAQQTYQMLCRKFPQEAPEHLLSVVGNWLWKAYILPALLDPDTWGVIDRGLSPMQKRNLREVSKVVGQIAAGRLFDRENVYLQPINPYISEALGRIYEIWEHLVEIKPAEEHFDIDEFNDLYSRTKPTLYMKLPDIFAVHQLVAQDLPTICPDHNDILREVVRELGSAKNNENDMMHVSTTEITLTLNPKFHDMEDPDAAVKSLFMETKRCVLYIIRVQTGQNLLDIMVRPITHADEQKWSDLVHDELRQQNQDPKNKNPYQDSSSLIDISSLSYKELKRTTLENIITLERTGRISRANHYQDILNEIALDIRSKHRRRIQRSREMDNSRATMSALEQKQVWLRSQLKSYNDYIEQAMVTLQQKAKGKKRFLMPFTKQYNHERELARNGRIPKFGSFKYSARNLADKGVLVGWRGFDMRQWDKINITVSSDEVGMFHVEGSADKMMIPGASASVALDGLLQAQFNNLHFICLFGDEGTGEGPLKLNVNLLVHLLMKKFYSQP
ncbi:IQ domain-containing protein [Microthyrium microscopicum]|uniref:IQ domain-containing protein n=1 Tax=Microthyrium microscopicum TaxID=703497 RepID=A0A6A6UE69_9PEZI|nr:IQ domain-containing protein [Microthyrium microscopicum]